MASAVLASRNESYCGDGKVYLGNYRNSTNKSHLSRFNPNPNPSQNPKFCLYPNPNPDLTGQSHESSSKPHLCQGEAPPQASRSTKPPPVSDFPSLSRSKAAVHEQKEYVTYRMDTFTKSDLKELKRRLISELEDVRCLRSRIEARHVLSRCGSHFSEISGSQGRYREVIRSPPLQVNQTLDSSQRILNPAAKQTKKAVVPQQGNKISGKKRAMPALSGKPLKRPEFLEFTTGKFLASMMKKCGQILAKLMKHKLGWVFLVPVDAAGMQLSDYHQIIKHPMDLGSVKSKLDNCEYETPLDFASDVRLTFENAMLYNGKGEDVHIMAETMLSIFDGMFNPAYKKYEAELARSEKTSAKAKSVPSQNQSTFLDQPVVHTQPIIKPRPTVNMVKPKTVDQNKRVMSYSEKESLGKSLQNLSMDQMEEMVQIIKKRNCQVVNEGDEIELDIEIMDDETLWELHRLVSKAAEREDLPIIKSPISEQRNKKADVVEEDVDIGEEIPISNFPVVEIERSSSSSGGSSSGSDSSSSSDSGSESDSDEDSVKSPFVEPTESTVVDC